jgi:hypothetical protein
MWENPNEDLEKLREFLKDNGIRLTFSSDPDNYLDYDAQEIVIASRQPSKHIVYTVLHEIGHYFLDIHFHEENKTTTVIEEVLAWDRGYDIGQTLRIDIDDDEWNSLMEKCIREYIEQ